MERSIYDLPPSKRFKLLHENKHHGELSIEFPLPLKCLPAKKRLYCHHPLAPICLPAKKRIWAPNPLFSFHESSQDSHSLLKKQITEQDDDVICAVCRSTDGEPEDPIVFCDGCDLMAHASCYGNPLIQSIPEGDWLCLRCEKKGTQEREAFDCFLCPAKGGAVKPIATQSQWAHIMCAILVPEVFFRDPVGRDGIDCSKIPEARWKIGCYICGDNRGCAIECSEARCGLGFHVSCGLGKDFCIEYKEVKGAGIVTGFCEEHTRLWKKQMLTGKFKIVPKDKLYHKTKMSE